MHTLICKYTHGFNKFILKKNIEIKKFKKLIQHICNTSINNTKYVLEK